tara:strand:- start:45 stop:326 length:282 start_codon:yes stop_codon:yes gene_type:complete
MSKFTSLTEIKEKNQRWPSNTRKYELAQILINSNLVATLRDAEDFKKEIKTFKGWPDGLDERIFITEICLSSQETHNIYVIGDIENIAKKLGG